MDSRTVGSDLATIGAIAARIHPEAARWPKEEDEDENTARHHESADPTGHELPGYQNTRPPTPTQPLTRQGDDGERFPESSLRR